jgi:hypothetical protein
MSHANKIYGRPHSESVTTEDIEAHKAKEVAHCEVHRKQEVAFYCEGELHQHFVCCLCACVRYNLFECIELFEANDKFITEIKNTLIPLQERSEKIDDTIRNISSAIKLLSANHDTVQQNINTVLASAEVMLQSLFDELLAAIKQCRNTAKQIVNKSLQRTDEYAASQSG